MLISINLHQAKILSYQRKKKLSSEKWYATKSKDGIKIIRKTVLNSDGKLTVWANYSEVAKEIRKQIIQQQKTVIRKSDQKMIRI